MMKMMNSEVVLRFRIANSIAYKSANMSNRKGANKQVGAMMKMMKNFIIT